MSMRSQVYEWNGLAPSSSTGNYTSANAGRAISIFIGGFGNNITKPAETTATEFVVIEDIAVAHQLFLQPAEPQHLFQQITVDNLVTLHLDR